MEIRFASESEVASWDELILKNPDKGNILQSQQFAHQKTLSGWKPRYILAGKVAIMALEKQILGIGKIWYVIKGPGVTDPAQLKEFLPGLKKFASKNGVFVIKIEPEIISTSQSLVDLMELGLLKVRNVQPNSSTVLLDTSKDLDEILLSLNQKGRHAIRRAERDGVVVKQVDSSDENCKEMFRLYKITAEGQFGTRPYSYYKRFWQDFSSAGLGQMFFAYYEGELIAGAYALIFGDKSTYKDGASVRERPVYGASHLLQWHVISWAKSRGAVVHDLSGAPHSSEINNQSHPYYGIGRFKTSFNKAVTDFVGTYDIVTLPYRYGLWIRIGEKLALRWQIWRHHENFY